jgi:lipoate---protein ligase
MHLLDLTFPIPEQNLACDEALLEWCENDTNREILRFWESSQHFVVLGYSNKPDAEVNISSCRDHSIPIFKRCSGGGTVLQGPGCLNYSLILKIDEKNLRTVTETNRFIMERHQKALEDCIREKVKIQGDTDLTLGDLKFSGNAQRRGRNFLLFHGTFLYSFEIELLEKFLSMPSKQPSYRNNRLHSKFATNLNVDCQEIKETLLDMWKPQKALESLPYEQIEKLSREKYSQQTWNS